MFKNKFNSILIILLILVALVFFIVFKTSKNQMDTENKLLSNNVKFSGKIVNYNVSKNHAFGILKLQIIESNIKKFNAFSQNKLFPYALEDSIAEIYTQIPIPEIEIGYKVEVNSNAKTIIFYDGEKIKYEWDIFIVSEGTDIDFVKKNTMFK